MYHEVGGSMDYRVNEVGALIFKPKGKDKPTVESLNKEVIELRTEIDLMKNEIAKIREKGE